MVKTNSIFALVLAFLLTAMLVPVALSQGGGSKVDFSVNPTLFAVGQPSSAFLCVSAKSIGQLVLGHSDTFVFSFGSSIGTLTSVSAPVTLNSSTLMSTDFGPAVNAATHQVVITYNGSAKPFGYGDSICVKVNFTAAAMTGSGDVLFTSRFTTSINGQSPFTTVSIVDFAAGPAGPVGPPGPKGDPGVKGDTGPAGAAKTILSWAGSVPPESPVGFVFDFDKLPGSPGSMMTMNVYFRDDNQFNAGQWQLLFDDGQHIGLGPCGGPPFGTIFSQTIHYLKPSGVHEIKILGQSSCAQCCQDSVLSRVVLVLN